MTTEAMTERHMTERWTGSGRAAVVAGIAFTALALRVLDLRSKWLWYDELQSVTHAALPIDDLVRSVRAFDPHPPLYYLQLHFWLLLGTGDTWIKSNSVLWSLLTVVSLFIVGRSIFNTRIGFLAAAIFAILPYSIAYAQEARMYALLMFLALWNYAFTHYFLTGRRDGWTGAGIVVTSVAILYSHGAGFLALASALTYAALLTLSGERQEYRRLLWWGALQAGIIVAYLPWISRTRTVVVGHPQAPGAADFFKTLFVLLFGVGQGYPVWLLWAGGMFVAILLAIIVVREASSRTFVLAYIVVPILSAALISHLVRPIWLPRTLASTVPFLALAIALFAAEILNSTAARTQRGRRLTYGLLLLSALLLLFATGIQQRSDSYPWNFREAANYVRETAEDGGMVYVPYERSFWCFNWYFLGPGAVNPLESSYQMTNGDDVTVLARPAVDEETFAAETAGAADGAGVSIVYRQSDDTDPFSKEGLISVADFAGLTVAYPARHSPVKPSTAP